MEKNDTQVVSVNRHKDKRTDYRVMIKVSTILAIRKKERKKEDYICEMSKQYLEKVHEGQYPNLFDNWTDTNLHLLLHKSSMCIKM